MVAIPQSGLLAQVSSLRLPSGHSGPVLTLSNAARASLVASGGCWRLCCFPTGGVTVGHVICGFYLFFLLVMLPSEVPRLTMDSPVRVFSGVWKLLSFLRLPSRDRSPSLPLLSLFLSFIFCPEGQISIPTSFVFLSILSYLCSKTMGCLSGCLMSSASVQMFFR